MVGIVSTVYTYFGGMEAVIWTDVIQLVVVYLGIAYLLVMVFNRIEGGFPEMWRIATERGHDFSYLKSAENW